MKASEYKKRIATYEKRRERSFKVSERLTSSICKMKRRLYSMEARERKRNDKIRRLIKLVNDFFGVDIKSINRDKEHRLARNVYFKIGIEKQLRQADLCRAIKKRGWSKTASTSRMRFTKSFKENPENKKIYYNFKNYYNSK